ncbi:MAG: CBS domain-containing protein [Thermoplasmata archaeon]|nr:CBS domain-containing protein [Candidatus Thermoplasmatota archaeon]MCJ2669007.1 CBS domain-containing protein [Candidatus Thermoplasmatota archaeon]MCK4949222.1 CBS domain-containing protein [Thermoplasmata archaeon]
MLDKGDLQVPVMEVMSRNLVTVQPKETVDSASKLMKDRGIGSLVVVKSGKPVGILTEKDIVAKVVAEDTKPSAVKVSQIMSSPVKTIHPHESIEDAAKLMAQNKIRRLVVSENDSLLGIVTENDIIKMWPHLIELTREVSRISPVSPTTSGVQGYCELCRVFAYDLQEVQGQLLCRDCRER